MKRILVFALLAMPAFAQFPQLIDPAQTLPANYVAIGGGLQGGGANLLGSFAVCHSVDATDLLCVRTDAAQGSRATALEGKHVVFARYGVTVAGTIAGGVATGSNGSVGGAFGGGGAGVIHLSQYVHRVPPNVSIGFDFRWNKQNVSVFTSNPTVATFRDFAHTWDKVFFVGYAWGGASK